MTFLQRVIGLLITAIVGLAAGFGIGYVLRDHPVAALAVTIGSATAGFVAWRIYRRRFV